MPARTDRTAPTKQPERPASSGRRVDEPRQNAQRRGFAGTVGARESVDFTGSDRQVRAARRTCFGEVFDQTECFNGGFFCCIHEPVAPRVITRTPEAVAEGVPQALPTGRPGFPALRSTAYKHPTGQGRPAHPYRPGLGIPAKEPAPSRYGQQPCRTRNRQIRHRSDQNQGQNAHQSVTAGAGGTPPARGLGVSAFRRGRGRAFPVPFCPWWRLRGRCIAPDRWR